MAEIIAAVLGFLLELAAEVVVEALFTGAIELLMDLVLLPFGKNHAGDDLHRAMKLGGVTLLGALVGGVSLLVLPRRVLPAAPVPGVSVLLSPIATGLIMWRYGEWRLSLGRATSLLATFWGGALFALGLASVRFFFMD